MWVNSVKYFGIAFRVGHSLNVYIGFQKFFNHVTALWVIFNLLMKDACSCLTPMLTCI